MGYKGPLERELIIIEMDVSGTIMETVQKS